VAACLIVGNPATLPLFLGGVAVGAVIGSLRDGNDLGTAVNDGAEAGVFAIGVHQGGTWAGSLLRGGGPGGGPTQGGSGSSSGSVFRGVGPQEANLIAETGGAVPSTQPGIPGVTRVFPPEVADKMDDYFSTQPPGTYTHIVEFQLTGWPSGAWLDSPWPTWIVPVKELNGLLAGPPIIRPR
jgi:hypothetical protein